MFYKHIGTYVNWLFQEIIHNYGNTIFSISETWIDELKEQGIQTFEKLDHLTTVLILACSHCNFLSAFRLEKAGATILAFSHILQHI